MRASIPRIVVSALLPEALPSIVRGIPSRLSLCLAIRLLRARLVPAVGGIAIRYGYYRFEDEMMVVTVVLLIIIVQLIQSACDFIARKIDHRTQA